MAKLGQGMISPLHHRLDVPQHLFRRSGFALLGVFLSAPDILQHIEPVHDLFHIRVIGEVGDDVDGLFLQWFHSDLDEFSSKELIFFHLGC